MKCTRCEFEFADSYKYCPECSMENIYRKDDNKQNVLKMKGNQNRLIGVNNSGKQHINYIDKIENVNVDNGKNKCIKYDFQPIGEVMGGEKGFLFKAKIMTFLSVLSAIITIVAWFFNPSSELIKLIFLLIFVCFAYAFSFYDKQKTLETNKEVKKDEFTLYRLEGEKVVKYSKTGICPICNGLVNIITNQNLNKKIGVCVNSSDHIFSYDHTINAGQFLEELVLESYRIK